jgi:16S rRNA (uracil1498-N3)-methyltransferase
MHRFFISPDASLKQKFTIRDTAIIHQISKVLRMQVGEKIILLDNTGFEFLCEIQEINKKTISVNIIAKNQNQNEAKIKINLFQALPNKQNKFEEILKHTTEIGISQFFPIITERSSHKLRNFTRLQKILRESAEQSERGMIPVLAEVKKFEQALNSLKGFSLIADSFCAEPLLSKLLPKIRMKKIVNIFVGPEGGFSKREIDFAKNNRILPFSLGGRILRTESAGVAVASAILFS